MTTLLHAPSLELRFDQHRVDLKELRDLLSKPITVWFRDIGLNVKCKVVDEGVINDGVWNYKGDTYAPDFDMYLWTWTGCADPSQTPDASTTAQIEGWSEPCWSNKELDRYYALQGHDLDKQKRAEDVNGVHKVMYADNPQSVTVYPKLRQAVDTTKWDGLICGGVGRGHAFFRGASQKTYLTFKPRSGVEAAGTSSTWIWAAAVALVLVVICCSRSTS